MRIEITLFNLTVQGNPITQSAQPTRTLCWGGLCRSMARKKIYYEYANVVSEEFEAITFFAIILSAKNVAIGS